MSTILLRDYQSDLVTRTGNALRRVRRALVVLPPGGGKTVIAAFIAQRFTGKNDRAYFNCHRSELLRQTSRTFTNCNLRHGFIAAGHTGHPGELAQICSIDTLKNRVPNIAPPKVALWDECHHIGAAGWAAIMKEWADTYHIGLTGSPWRLDGTGLGEFFDEMVLGPTARELIDMGNLSEYQLYAPSAPDMKGVHKERGDFAKGESAERMSKPKLVGDMITHWRKHANGMRTVGYACNVKHSRFMAEEFNRHGIPSAHLDGDTPAFERARIITEFVEGKILVLWNVNLFSEGFDLSAYAGRDVRIEAVILARPTNSLSLYLQQTMRCMRPGGIGVILDHAGNSHRHGFPDDERDWTLDGKAKGKAANDNAPPPPVTCSGCFMQIRRPLPQCCPGCGKQLEAEARQIEVAEGELKLQGDEDKEAIRRQLKREQGEAKTLDELVNLARKREYKDPLTWARKVFYGRRRAA
jgi:superfamily II DNA or RNA helicase